ncbi:MAG TPA: LysM domain-containing protein [Burkholderiales bacterium]|nr:LysM domain-containing protein [Burkholderiales bacterium]
MPKQCRKSITTLVFVLAWALCGLASAQAPKTPLELKPDAPDRYVVVKGDTLWSIAQRYTDSPWRWPELWNMNKDQIKNPHRIYPGDVIVLDRAHRQLALSGTVKLSPHVRAESTAREEIPSIPPSIIEPFLTRPLVVEPDGLDNAPTVVATEESHVYLGAGDRAYVKGMSGAAKDSVWYMYRRGPALVDPETQTTLGYEALYLGTARVQTAGDPAVVELTSVTQEVGIGDKLVAAGKPEIPTYAPRAPSASIHGRVISLYGGGTQLGEGGEQAVVAINRGKSQGVEVGNVLALYRPGSVLAAAAHAQRGTPGFELPDERYGLAFVFRVFDKVSYALVMNVSRPVNKLDLVQNP